MQTPSTIKKGLSPFNGPAPSVTMSSLLRLRSRRLIRLLHQLLHQGLHLNERTLNQHVHQILKLLLVERQVDFVHFVSPNGMVVSTFFGSGFGGTTGSTTGSGVA